MDKYERHASLYSAWGALLVPAFLTMYILEGMEVGFMEGEKNWMKYVSLIMTTLGLYAAIGYYIRELFRIVSKVLLQFRLFKEDETRMPTTELILWKNHSLSDEELTLLRKKMYEKHGYKMMTSKEEADKEDEVRRNIVGAVRLMREDTRGDKILLQANWRYGFWRNLFGGLICSAVAIILFLFICVVFHLPFVTLSLYALILVFLQICLAYIAIHVSAKDYARSLVSVFLSGGM